MGFTNEFKVMTFNLRVAGDHDGINRFDFRQPRIRSLLRTEAPDIIGFQEAVAASREWVRRELADDYELIGCGRDENCEGEGIPIAFRRDRFALLSWDTFWLSDTPNVPGSRFAQSDQSRFPRMTHSALLKIRNQSGFLRVINTHLDHVGKEARRLELCMLADRILAESGCPAVLLGDFNGRPYFPEIESFTARMAASGWQDATADLGGTYHKYGRLENPIKIDYIYTNCSFRESRVVNTAPENGVYDSDHFAVVSTLTVESSEAVAVRQEA